MRHLRQYIIFFIWLIPAVVLLYWLLSKDSVKEIKDGIYLVGNKTLEWELEVTDGVLRSNQLSNRKTGEKLPLSGEEFALRAGHKKDIGWTTRGEETVCGLKVFQTITPDKCLPVQYKKENDRFAFFYYYSPLKLSLKLEYSYDAKSPFIHRALTVESFNDEELVIEDAVLGNWISAKNVTGGGKGLPVFLDDKWFLTGEAPWFDTQIKDNAVVMHEYPSAFLKYGSKYASDPVLAGGGDKNPRKLLSDYIRTVILPPKFVTVYNTWCDFRRDNLKCDNVVNAFLKLCEGLRTYGAGIDYCLVDDHWFRTSSVYQTNSQLFPNGLAEVSESVTPYNANLGLWLTYSSMMSDLAYLKNEGYEMANVYYACLSGEKYNAALKEAIKDKLLIDRVRCFKHDFNYFVCTRTEHGHLNSKEQSTEANMRKTMEMLEFERELVPDLHQSITTGINHSPWWLRYAHILWMGGKDKDYDLSRPVTSRSQGEMRCRDGLLYQQQVEEKEFFPLYALMTHGMINGLLDTAGPWLDDFQWSDYIMNYLGRGTALREIYIHPRELNDKKFEVLGRGLHWANEHNELMLDSEMILGDPRKDELYGFRGHDGKGHVYVSLRNPGFKDRAVSLKDVGIESTYYRVSYPYHVIYETKLYPNLTVPAESVVIAEAVELKDLKEPSLINIRYERQNVTGSSARFVIYTEGSDPNPVYVYSPYNIKKLLGLHAIKEISKKLWRGSRPGEQDIQRVTVSKPFAASGAGFNFDIIVPEGAAVMPVWTINDKNAQMEMTDNGKPVDLKIISFPKTNWQVAYFNLGKGPHKLMGRLSKSARSVTSMDLQLRATYDLKPLELQLIHKLARGQNPNNFELPAPISQGLFRETTELAANVQLQTAPKKLFDNIEEAEIQLEIFDVNGGAYTNKVLTVNEVPAGLVPPNAPPISSWQQATVKLPPEALKTVGNANAIGIIDETGDAYKIRNLSLKVTRKDGSTVTMSDTHVFCTSPTWSLHEGEVMKTDGSTIVLLGQ